jgi:hypothetical protein
MLRFCIASAGRLYRRRSTTVGTQVVTLDLSVGFQRNRVKVRTLHRVSSGGLPGQTAPQCSPTPASRQTASSCRVCIHKPPDGLKQRFPNDVVRRTKTRLTRLEEQRGGLVSGRPPQGALGWRDIPAEGSLCQDEIANLGLVCACANFNSSTTRSRSSANASIALANSSMTRCRGASVPGVARLSRTDRNVLRAVCDSSCSDLSSDIAHSSMCRRTAGSLGGSGKTTIAQRHTANLKVGKDVPDVRGSFDEHGAWVRYVCKGSVDIHRVEKSCFAGSCGVGQGSPGTVP